MRAMIMNLNFCFQCQRGRDCWNCPELDEWIDDHCKREIQRPDATWKDYGDGIFCCSACGMPGGWAHPALKEQTLGEFCESCGAKMSNGYQTLSNRTPRETVRAAWIQKEKGARQYFCSVCGGKESAPRVWCPRCGTHMDDGAWEKRWAVRKEWEQRGVAYPWRIDVEKGEEPQT